MTRQDRSTIERALGIIEGVACGVPDNYKDILYTAVELIEVALVKEDAE